MSNDARDFTAALFGDTDRPGTPADEPDDNHDLRDFARALFNTDTDSNEEIS